MKRLSWIVVLGVVIAGCAPAPKYSEPPRRPAQAATPAATPSRVAYILASSVRAGDEVVAGSRQLDPKQPVYYFQNYGGGGAGLGILLGPIGVAANAKMIASKTDQEVANLNGKNKINVSAAVETAAESIPLLEERAGADVYTLKPYVLLVKREQGDLLIATGIDASQGSWRGRYVYHLDGVQYVSKFFDGSPNHPEIISGFSEALQMFIADTRGQLRSGRDVNFYTEATSPRIKMPLQCKVADDRGQYVTVQCPAANGEYGSLAAGYHKVVRTSAEIKNR